MDVDVAVGAPFPCFPLLSALTPISHADAYETLVATSQVHPQITEPLALPTLSTVAGPAVYPANQSNPQTASPLSPPTLSAESGAAVFAPNSPISNSLQPNLQYI